MDRCATPIWDVGLVSLLLTLIGTITGGVVTGGVVTGGVVTGGVVTGGVVVAPPTVME
jgi:hypothetical protein